MEWANQYNSFNSLKGLTYYQNYKQIVDWMDGTDYLPPPVEVNLDPIAECNLDCYFCITQRYLKTNRAEVEMRKLPIEYILKLIDFLSWWGVRGLCISGGGEPTLHRDFPKMVRYAVGLGMDVAPVTNATNITPEIADSLMLCRWVAMSVDSGNSETYQKVKGKDLFDQVIANIQQLTGLRRFSNSKVDLCFKFLLLPENVSSMYRACKLAKELGVQDFHVRPVDLERSDIEGHRKLNLDREFVYEQFEKCHEEETDDFHVYTVTHKFDADFHVTHNFEQCLATPLVLPILTDGNAYLCVDKKMEKPFKIGSCYPDPESILDWWGSNEHRDLIQSVNISHCSRCTWSQYQKQIEVVISDRMCLAFP